MLAQEHPPPLTASNSITISAVENEIVRLNGGNDVQ